MVLRKGRETIVTDGKRVFVNRTGNAGMATGGSGDVLAGILTALLGQGVPPLLAAAAGAWLHGRAGIWRRTGWGSMPCAGDLLEAIPRLLP